MSFYFYLDINKFIVQQVMAICLLQIVVKVAVIGAGISGIGSSLSLTQNNIEHIVIEARDRIGGRITSKKFDGVSIQLGAAFIHKVNPKNRIAQIVKEEGWSRTVINASASYFSYQGQGLLNQAAAANGAEISSQLCHLIVSKQNISTKPLSLKQAAGNYLETLTNYSKQSIDTGYWYYNLMGNYNGADLADLGTRFCQEGELGEGDYIINDGYSTFIKHLFRKTKPRDVYLNQQVRRIDYSGKNVKIYTKNHIYSAQKVISSLPLGVLRKNSVEFVPKLPQAQEKAFFDLGVGIYNKVFVSFQQPFWNLELEWVDFITKDTNNKYPVSRSVSKQGKYILCFFVADQSSKQVSKFTNKQLHDDMLSFLKRFYPTKDIKIRAIEATSWHEDPYSLISYSYERVGRNAAAAINKICATVDNKIWFVGEHCHPSLYSYSHGGFETGIWAAQKIATLLK